MVKVMCYDKVVYKVVILAGGFNLFMKREGSFKENLDVPVYIFIIQLLFFISLSK